MISGTSFDIAASAGWYSAVAGLLAGFALLAVLLPLDHEAEEDDPTYGSNAVVVFTCAFFALVALSIAYAVLAGRTDATDASLGTAAHEQMLLGAAFGLSTLLLLFGLHAVLRTYGANKEVFEPARRVIIVVTSVLAPVLVLALQFSNTLEMQEVRGDAVGNLTGGTIVNLGLVGLGMLGIAGVAWRRHQLPVVGTAPQTLAKAVLGYTVAVIVWTAVAAPLLPVEFITGSVVEHVVLGLTAVAVVAVSIASWTGR